MNITRKPEWLQKKINPAAHAEMERLLGDHRLHTVCQEAMCPNISECFRNRQATFLILGKHCTRLCSFCNVTKEMPLPADLAEPARVAAAVARLGLSHVVITSPTRDDLPDGGADLYAATVAAIRAASPATRVELLIPDFQGDPKSVATVLGLTTSISDGGQGGEEGATEAYHEVRRGATDEANAGIRSKAKSCPDILGHNVETVPRLYAIRSGADYRRSLAVLETARELAHALPTKSGVMLGLGETEAEVLAVFSDLRRAGCSYLSVGQYLAPSRRHYPVQEFVRPEQFERLQAKALAMGFIHVESGPYVRSSYLAEQYCGE